MTACVAALSGFSCFVVFWRLDGPTSVLTSRAFGGPGISFFGENQDWGDHFTFDNFGVALVTLFRCATADSWETRMYASRSYSKWSPLYYLAFMVFCSMVMLNLFIAVILVRAAAWRS